MTGIRALAGILQKERVGEIRLEERLAPYTSLKVGGPCRAMVRPPDVASLERLIHLLGEMEIPYMPLGGGSNLLIADGGFDGVVVNTDALQDWEELGPGSVRLGAGVSTARVLKWTARGDLSGFEGLTGVPGTIGGACVMNAGGRGGNVSDALQHVEVVTSPPEVHVVEVEAAALQLAYRSSSLPAGSVIGSATFQFVPDPVPGAVAARVGDLLDHRMRTQPAGVLSCGSVFRNPAGDQAGRLVESCGLKGEREGAVVVSDMHANYFVNRGGGTARDVRALIDRVQRIVYEKTGVRLQREVVVVGFPEDPVSDRIWWPPSEAFQTPDDTEVRGFGAGSGEDEA